jgi:hypothetical protein
MAPVILSAVTGDSPPPDQVVDQVTITMSETIDNNSLVPADTMFAVTPPATPAWAQVAFNVLQADKTGATTVLLKLQSVGPQPPPPDTTVSGLTVVVKANPNGVRDATRHFGASTQTVDDGIPPQLLGITSHASVAGRLDQLVADFSEPLQPSTDTAVWHLTTPTGWSSPPSVSNVNVNGSQVTLTVNPSSVPLTPDTAAATLAATLDPSATTGIRDSAGNPATFTNRSVTDGMAPLLTSIIFGGGTQPGLFETGDVLVATFSEPLAPAATTTPTVKLVELVGATTATLDIPGLTDGPIDTLSSSYFITDGSAAQWPATVVRSGKTITVTLTGPCTGTVTDPTCANLTAGTPVNTPIDLTTTIVDRAVPTPNVVLDATLNIRWF